jgi:hypothetical protein
MSIAVQMQRTHVKAAMLVSRHAQSIVMNATREINFKADTARYCILPDGNATEFPKLDAELVRRRIAAQYVPMRAGGRIYRIPKRQLTKLPKDARGRYLGDDESGHTIYSLPLQYINEVAEAGWVWLDIVQEIK